MAEINNTNDGSQSPTKESLEQTCQKLKTLTGEKELRLQNLQTTAFQLANYYFVFQGVILAAMSNTSSLTCHDRWFLFTLSFLAALLNLCALFALGVSYIRTMQERDSLWEECNSAYGRLQMLKNGQQKQPINVVVDQNGSCNGSQDQPWTDRYRENKRWLCLGACAVVFLAFAGVTLGGCWRILCRHGHHGKGSCVKLCDGFKCLKFCNVF